MPTKVCFLLEGGGGTDTSLLNPRGTWTSQREMSALLPLTLGPSLPGQALGPLPSGTRRRKGRSLLSRICFLMVNPPFLLSSCLLKYVYVPVRVWLDM